MPFLGRDHPPLWSGPAGPVGAVAESSPVPQLNLRDAVEFRIPLDSHRERAVGGTARGEGKGLTQVAMVTGEAGGIGGAVSKALLRVGFQVNGVDQDEVRLKGAAEELGPSGDRLMPRTADLTQSDQVERLFHAIREERGGPEFLVNNAGTGHMSVLGEIDAEELGRQMAVDYESPFCCDQQAVPLMLSRPGVKKIMSIFSNGA